MGFTEEQAKDMAEPEGQDYYGLGSRSARWCITFCIAIVFGTMSPPVSLLGLITFAWLRLIYGYLLVFAETRKPDLGGYFWVSQLRHIFVGLYIYLSVMVGVFICLRLLVEKALRPRFLVGEPTLHGMRRWHSS